MKSFKLFFMLIVTVLLQNCSDISTDPNTQNEILYNTWERISPFKGSWVVSMFGTENGLVFLGTGGSEVYSSNDFGTTWKYNDSCFVPGNVGGFAINSKNDIFIIASHSLLKSTDNGKNWECLYMKSNKSYYDNITIDANDIIYISTQDNIYRSNDDGNTWIDATNNLPNDTYLNKMVTDAYNNVYIGTNNNGIFISKNFGNSWNEINSGLNFYNQPMQIFSLVKDRYNNVYAGGNYGLYKLNDGETNWNKINITTNSVESISVMDSLIIASTWDSSLYVSKNLGQNWSKSQNGLPKDAYISTITVTGNILLVGTSKGVYKSSDKGYSWCECNSGLYSKPSAVVSDNSGKLFISINKSIFQSNNNGKNWVPFGTDLPDDIRAIMFNSNNELIAATSDCVYLSHDNGASWLKTLGTLGQNLDISCFIKDLNNTIYMTCNKALCKSTDNGITWIEANEGLPENTLINNVEISSNNVILITTSQYGVFKSLDSGSSWLKVDYFNDEYVTDIAIDKKKIFIYAAKYLEGLFKSIDDGISWSQVQVDLPPNVVLIDTNKEGKMIYVTNQQVYLSNSYLTQWTDLNNNYFPYTTVSGSVWLDNTIILNSDYGVLRYIIK